MAAETEGAGTGRQILTGGYSAALCTIFANSAQQSVNQAIGSGFKGDYIVLPLNQFTFAGVSPKLSDDLRQIDGVQTVTSIGIVPAQLPLPNGDKPNSVIGGIDNIPAAA